MRYAGSCQCTRAILPAGDLAALLSGRDAPADLAQEAASGPFLGQYDPSRPHSVRRPEVLSLTDLADAFTPQ